jgi:hypothetical protein
MQRMNIEALNELQTISAELFPSRPRDFALYHHDLSLANILVDPTTYEITGIVDWECVGTRPHWEDTYPPFLIADGSESEGEVEPLDPRRYGRTQGGMLGELGKEAVTPSV